MTNSLKWISPLFFLFISIVFFGACSQVDSSVKLLEEKDQTLLKEGYKSYKSGQFTIHYPGESYAASQLASYDQELANAKLKVLTIVGVPAYEEELQIIIFETIEAFNAHLSSPGQFFVNRTHPVYYVVHNENIRPYFTHGLFQKVAVANWGAPRGGLMLVEGGAFYADARCQDYQYPFDEVGTYLAHKNNLMSYRAMMKRFSPAFEQSPNLASIQAAGLFQFIYDNFGRDKIKTLWQTGIGRVEGSIGMTPGEVEKEIIQRWLRMDPKDNIDWENIQKFGC